MRSVKTFCSFVWRAWESWGISQKTTLFMGSALRIEMRVWLLYVCFCGSEEMNLWMIRTSYHSRLLFWNWMWRRLSDFRGLLHLLNFLCCTLSDPLNHTLNPSLSFPSFLNSHVRMHGYWHIFGFVFESQLSHTDMRGVRRSPRTSRILLYMTLMLCQSAKLSCEPFLSLLMSSVARVSALRFDFTFVPSEKFPSIWNGLTIFRRRNQKHVK